MREKNVLGSKHSVDRSIEERGECCKRLNSSVINERLVKLFLSFHFALKLLLSTLENTKLMKV